MKPRLERAKTERERVRRDTGANTDTTRKRTTRRLLLPLPLPLLPARVEREGERRAAHSLLRPLLQLADARNRHPDHEKKGRAEQDSYKTSKQAYPTTVSTARGECKWTILKAKIDSEKNTSREKDQRGTQRREKQFNEKQKCPCCLPLISTRTSGSQLCRRRRHFRT